MIHPKILFLRDVLILFSCLPCMMYSRMHPLLAMAPKSCILLSKALADKMACCQFVDPEANENDLHSPIYHVKKYEVEDIHPEGCEKIDWGLRMLSIPDLWRKTRGRNVKVAVLDTGIDTNHSDLKGAVLERANFTRCMHGNTGHRRAWYARGRNHRSKAR